MNEMYDELTLWKIEAFQQFSFTAIDMKHSENSRFEHSSANFDLLTEIN